MHYSGMEAMRMQGMHHYSSALVTLSVVLAIVLSFMALSLTYLFRPGPPGRFSRKHASALLRGAANPLLHFTALAAASFTYSSVVPDLSHAVSITPIGVFGIVIVQLMAPVVSLLTSLVDRLRK